MQELETLGVAYLFKLQQTKGVKELVSLCELQSEWENALGNWQYCESSLQLCGWSQSRRVDNENCYDELKNQCGWGGFTLKDLARSELMARFIALIYNWWSIFTKLADEQIAREAITSRPMLLMHTAKVSTHQSTRTLVVFCAQAQAERIKEMLEVAVERLKAWASLTAEQLKKRSVWKRIVEHILIYHQTVGAAKSRSPPMIELQP